MTKKNEKQASVSEIEDSLELEAQAQERKAEEWRRHQESMAHLPEVATVDPSSPRPIWDTSHIELKVDASERKPIEFWAEHLGTPKWLFAGTKIGKDWPIGKELTRKDYEDAVQWAANVPSH